MRQTALPDRREPEVIRLGHDRRRFTLAGLTAGLAVTAALAAGPAVAAEPLKVAAVYTVPVEQQWVSRIHKALNAAKDRGEITYQWSENVANTDYERVMREYAEGGAGLVLGEVFGVERAARKVAPDYPRRPFLMGSSFGPEQPNFAVFDNYIQECSYLTGLVAGSLTKSNLVGMVGGYPIPEVNRLMHAFMDGAREVNPDGEVHGLVHRLLVRPAQGEGGRLRDDRAGRRRHVRGAVRRLGRGQGAGRQGGRQRRRYPGPVPRHRGRQRALAHGAVDREGPGGGQGRQLQGGGLRALEQPRRRRLHRGAYEARARARGRHRHGEGEGGRDPRGRASR
jgi:hypothetical protein